MSTYLWPAVQETPWFLAVGDATITCSAAPDAFSEGCLGLPFSLQSLKRKECVFSCGAYPCAWSHITPLQSASVWEWYTGTFCTTLHRQWLLLRFRNLVHIAIFLLYHVPPKSGGPWKLGRTQECAHLPSFTKQVCSWLKYYWNKNKTTLIFLFIEWPVEWKQLITRIAMKFLLIVIY